MAWWLQGDLQPLHILGAGWGAALAAPQEPPAAAAGRESRPQGGWAAPCSDPLQGLG